MVPEDLSATERLIESLLLDDDFGQLEEMTQPFNVFEVLGAVQQETRHSNVLAWLLNPSANHGLGDEFLKRFLWKTTDMARDRGFETIRPLDVDSLDFSALICRREWRNIDIILISQAHAFVCAIENKVSSGESGDQLERYARTCQEEFPDYKRHLILLSASGLEPSSPDWLPVGYDVVHDVLERCTRARRSAVSQDVHAFLEQYDDMLRRYILGDSTIEALCQRIYTRHQRALDLLLEYRPDRQLEINSIVQEAVRSDPDLDLDNCTKQLVRFAPTTWEPVAARWGSGEWTKSRRMMLFEFNTNPDYGLSLTLYIGPGEQRMRKQVFDVAHASPIFKPTMKILGKKWNQIWTVEVLPAEDYAHDLESLEARIVEFMGKFKASQLPAIDRLIRPALVA